LYRLPSFEPVPLPKMEPGVVSVRKLEKDFIVYTLSNARSPGISYRCDLAVAPPTARELTTPDAQGIDIKSFSLPQLIKYKSSLDGLEIPAFLYLPPKYEAGKPIPFIVHYHGGPEGQSRPGYSNLTQYLLAEGFGVLEPNVRGSAGYGRSYLMLDDYKKRWDSVRDGVDAAEWLIEKGFAQPGKIATSGGSYGGFMSVACLIEDQERVDAGKRKERCFGAGVDVVGITNLKTFLEKTAGYRRKLREVEYAPLSDPDFLASVSAMNRIDKIQVPLFIAHGFNDPRVPVEEAMQMAIALKDAAVAAKDPRRMPQLFIAPDEGHGFAKLDNRLLYTSRMVAFLKEKLK
jgi:dipeptidyl aminopeptidase/acylaminoacyl peptidase